MTDQRKINVQHTFRKVHVSPDRLPEDIILFRAPVILDGSGSYKRLPHQVQWANLQEGDAVIAMVLGDGPSGQAILDLFQFWNVLSIDDDVFEIEVNNIAGMAGDGVYVYNQIAALVGLPPETP